MSIGSNEILQYDGVLKSITEASSLFQLSSIYDFLFVQNKAIILQGALLNKLCN